MTRPKCKARDFRVVSAEGQLRYAFFDDTDTTVDINCQVSADISMSTSTVNGVLYCTCVVASLAVYNTKCGKRLGYTPIIGQSMIMLIVLYFSIASIPYYSHYS